MPNLLLRVRNLKTNFYTYAGVVKALEGVSFDMWEGETLGLVGETGCGKSVTALSVLRLIPQPPGKIEEGEVLFDVPEETAAEIERREGEVFALLPRVFGESPEAHPEELSVTRLNALWNAARQQQGTDPAALASLSEAFKALWQLKRPYDLVSKSEADMRAIRGNRIAMIFQEPMQALNPVFPIGDQIAENILLHQRPAVVRSLVQKMELESERDGIGRELRKADPSGATSPRPLPRLPPPPPRLAALAVVWFAIGLVGGLLPALGLLAGTGMGPSFGIAAAIALACVLVAGALWDLRPWSRDIALALAAVQGLSSAFFALLPFDVPFRLFFLAAAVVDLYLFFFLWQPESRAMVAGRHAGWEAALIQAEGDAGALSEFRDWVAGSALDERVREAVIARLDAFAEHANQILERDEPVSGHLHPLFPRAFQLSFYRGLRDRPGASVAGVVRRLPLAKRAVERPIYEEAVRRAIAILRKVKISDPTRIAGQYPYELSGGMQQRALIAIALSCNPRLLIADEPTTALDVTIQAQILELIRQMKTEFGSSVLIITHDLGIIAEMCNRVCVMYAGHIVEDASVRAVFKAPLHPYTQGLMKAVPTHTARRASLEIIRGSVPNLIYPPPGCRFHPRCPLVMPTCGWSPAEVGEQLRTLMKSMAAGAPSPFDVDAIAWEEGGPSELRAVFPEGISLDDGADAIRRAMASGRDRPAIGAVVAVEAAPETTPAYVRVRILNPQRPPDFVPQPGHKVACLLYESPPTEPLAGGARAG